MPWASQPAHHPCLPYLVCPKNIELYEKYKVYNEAELRSRYEVNLETYAKVLHIEAHTMVSMTQKDIVPAAIRYGRELAETIVAKKAAVAGMDCTAEETLLTRINALTGALCSSLETLREKLGAADRLTGDAQTVANFYRDEIVPAMETLRAAADGLEVLVAKDQWPFPSYGDILFSVR